MAETDGPAKQKDEPERHAFAMACRLLSRREYSALELRQRLSLKGYGAEVSEKVVERLRGQGLQSDSRFAEMFCSARLARGYGPRRIAAELSQRGIADEVIARHLEADPQEWRRAVKAALRKRYKAVPQTALERAKAERFLRQKGFSSDQIRYALRAGSDDDLM